MIKVQPIVRDLLLQDIEACHALTNGYMNMSSFAHRLRQQVETLTKKQVTINSIVVALSRVRKEFKKEPPLVHEVNITNITTKLPLSELVYENTSSSLAKLESLYKNITITRDDFFTTTVSMTEINIVCSSSLHDRIIKHFDQTKPKYSVHNLAAVALSIDLKHFHTPNTLFSLIAAVARARINIVELVSTYTELICIVSEKDFAKTVSLFSRSISKKGVGVRDSLT